MGLPLFRSSMRGVLGRLSHPRPPPDGPGDTEFECNLCGTRNRVPAALLSREIPSCRACGSTVRFRGIVQLLVRELFGRDSPLPKLGRHREIRGMGLTDSGTYADRLASHFDYVNTHFDREPRLDITEVPEELAGRNQFVISSDVFEHVAPPVQRAFEGARRLLAPRGMLILTVPFGLAGETIEHYPHLFDYRIEGEGDSAVLHNTTRDGRVQRFDRPVFHGGSGATLEMRCFSRAGVAAELARAGFSRIAFCGEPCPRFGILWPEPWSIPIVAHVD